MTTAPSPHPGSRVTFREITAETVRAVCRLAVSEAQQKFVAPNAISISEAHFEPAAWFRAVYADDTPVGFVMLELKPERDYVYLWRFMIDQRWQKMGFGRQALELVLDVARARPGTVEVQLSCVQADGGPQPFYERYGFRFTGEYEEGEAILKRAL